MASWCCPSPYTWRCQIVLVLFFSVAVMLYVILRSNVLIDRYFTAKLGDFGFTQELPLSTSGHTMVTAVAVAKSLGYCPPEHDTCHISPKSDVYSYGIVSHNVSVYGIVSHNVSVIIFL